MGAWEFTETKTPPPEADRRADLASAVIIAGGDAAAAVARGAAFGEGISLARRLAMMPGNLCTPEYLAETGRGIAKRHDMLVTILGRAEMEKEQMGSFLCVAQGMPQQDPKLIVLEHRKGPKGGKPVVLVGKGLCFDTGGISIKPADRDGVHEVRHVRRRGRARRDGDDRPARPAGECRRTRGRDDEHAERHGGEAGRRGAQPARQVHRDHQHRCRRAARARAMS